MVSSCFHYFPSAPILPLHFLAASCFCHRALFGVQIVFPQSRSNFGRHFLIGRCGAYSILGALGFILENDRAQYHLSFGAVSRRSSSDPQNFNIQLAVGGLFLHNIHLHARLFLIKVSLPRKMKASACEACRGVSGLWRMACSNNARDHRGQCAGSCVEPCSGCVVAFFVSVCVGVCACFCLCLFCCCCSCTHVFCDITTS